MKICLHGRRQVQCGPCGGTSICEHGRRRSYCLECSGASVCQHGRRRTQCRLCEGTSICVHNKRRSYCVKCKGASICEHSKRRSTCKYCSPRGYLVHRIRCRLRLVLRGSKTKRTLEYLGCSEADFCEYIGRWCDVYNDTKRYGDFVLDKDVPNFELEHWLPLTPRHGISDEEFQHRLRYTNIHPMPLHENRKKSNKEPSGPLAIPWLSTLGEYCEDAREEIDKEHDPCLLKVHGVQNRK